MGFNDSETAQFWLLYDNLYGFIRRFSKIDCRFDVSRLYEQEAGDEKEEEEEVE